MSSAIFGAAALFVWTRCRLLLAALGFSYVLLLIGSQIPSIEQTWQYWSVTVPVLIFAPLVAPLICFAGDINADMAAPEGLFPRRFFILPATVSQMVLPFMVYAALLAAVQWSLAGVISHGRVLGPASGRLWLPFLTTGFVAWLQALMWTPTRRRGVRWSQLLTLLFVFIVSVVGSLAKVLSPIIVIVLSIAGWAMAYAVALNGVSKARRGEPSHVVTEQRAVSIAAAAGKSRVPEFQSPLEAQLWMERRLHRWAGIPVIAALMLVVPVTVLPLMAVYLIRAGDSARGALAGLAELAINGLLTGLVLCGILTGLSFATFRPSLRSLDRAKGYPMPPYFAALPVTAGDFSWTKMRAATERTLLLSAGVLLICAILAQIFGLAGAWMTRHTDWRTAYGLTATLALGALPYVSLVLWVLSAAASAIWVALAGRAVYLACLFGCSAVVGFGPMLWPHLAGAGVVTITLPIAAALKLIGLAALILYVGSRRLLSWSRLAVIASVWVVTGASLMASFSWYPPAGLGGSLNALCISIILAPVLGAVAAPIALTFNRVR